MNEFISEEELKGTFAYLDNVTICGRMQVEHANNLNAFLNAAKRCNITYSPEKCVFSVTELHIPGCVVKSGEIWPDPERLHPLQDLPVLSDMKAHKRIFGFSSYYSNWITGCSDKIQPLVTMKTFPYTPEAAEAFKVLKKTIEESVVCSIYESVRFDIETDASDFATAATLNQAGRPVAFFPCTLQGPERRHASVEKEEQAIIETVRHWKHYLTGRHFSLKTDQRSVAYMFDRKQREHFSLKMDQRSVAYMFGRKQRGHFSLKTDQRSVVYMFDSKQRSHFSLKTDQRSVAYMFDRKQRGKIKNDKIM